MLRVFNYLDNLFPLCQSVNSNLKSRQTRQYVVMYCDVLCCVTLSFLLRCIVFVLYFVLCYVGSVVLFCVVLCCFVLCCVVLCCLLRLKLLLILNYCLMANHERYKYIKYLTSNNRVSEILIFLFIAHKLY